MIVYHVDRRAILALLAGVAFVLPGCGAAGERLPDYRYRLTVEVDTPEGLRSGASVIEVRTELAGKAKLPDANALYVEYSGEAVTIDLRERGLLFVLLRSEDFRGWAGGAMNLVTPRPAPVPGKNSYAVWHERMVANQGVHVLPRIDPEEARRASRPLPDLNDLPRAYPIFVRFGDIADPATVAKVDPDDLAGAFGQGVKLRRITVQLTDDPVTTGIEKKLGWLKTTTGALVHIPVSDYPQSGTRLPLYATLTELDFIQGDK